MYFIPFPHCRATQKCLHFVVYSLQDIVVSAAENTLYLQLKCCYPILLVLFCPSPAPQKRPTDFSLFHNLIQSLCSVSVILTQEWPVWPNRRSYLYYRAAVPPNSLWLLLKLWTKSGFLLYSGMVPCLTFPLAQAS